MQKMKFTHPVKFEWDTGNSKKNEVKHGVTTSECEEVFFRQPLLVASDEKHSDDEQRFYALGQTAMSRKLFVVFTFRAEKVRVISARDMSRKEREIYAEAQTNSEVQD